MPNMYNIATYEITFTRYTRVIIVYLTSNKVSDEMTNVNLDIYLFFSSFLAKRKTR